MLLNTITVALALVLASLSALHVFWAVRGGTGDSVVVPKVGGKPAFVPSRASTWLVAAALLTAAGVALLQGGLLHSALPAMPVRLAAMGAGSAFLLRAIGELRLVGFFKRVRGTAFARWDDWLFSPLCVLIGAGFWLLALH